MGRETDEFTEEALMQNYKIKRMSYKRINEWLQAITMLTKIYKQGEKVLYCPFCVLVGCSNCLWKIFEGKQCFDFQRELGIDGEITEIRNHKKWQTARIPMLRRWKKILQAEKDTRTEGGG